MATGIILLHWKNQELIRRQVEQISSWQNPDLRLLVIDNGGDLQLEDPIDERIIIIKPDSNLGYSGGCNIGIERAMKEQLSHCMLLNPDVLIEEDQFNQLLACGEKHKHWHAWSPIIKEENDISDAYHLGGRDPGLYLNSRIASDSTEMKEPEVIDYLPGTALMCRTELFTKTSLLDTRYFIGGEVADLFFQMKVKGLAYGLCKDTILIHTREGNVHLRKYLHTYYNFRNRFLLIDKFHTKNAMPIRGMWKILLYRQILGAIVRGDFKKAKVVYWALKDGLGQKFGKSSRKLI
jgi:GT2 family glycosyltransferase